MSTFKYFSVSIVYLLILIVRSQADTTKVPTDRYRQEALAQHNSYRAQCKADALQSNTTLDSIAQDWCGELVRTGQFSHSGTTDYGENSYKKTPWDFANDNGATPVAYWFGEKSRTNSTRAEDNLHFTQVVWKSTKSFGLGVCQLTDGGLLFVANYYPRGNYKDQFAQNVAC